ncbi:uncharacterized protein [Rutidosis leptorrhynchoides]|uniref:uncharacterized protein n=1 Tax=Rutidosis leptorrhynchoides TaxID=125765 RepID=UPI003A99C605
MFFQKSSSMDDQSKLPAPQPINHIIQSVPIKVEIETSQYNSWAELFKIHCRAHDLIDHLSYESPTEAVAANLLNTILETDTTAKKTWDRLKGIFHDNQGSHAVVLEHKFTNLKLANFPNISAYCQEVKMLADQMKNVGLDVTDQRMVLQLVAGLGDSYETIGTYISQSEKLPNFYEAGSKLILEESRKNRNFNPEIQPESTLNTTTGSRTTLCSNDGHNRSGNFQVNPNRGGRSGGRGGRPSWDPNHSWAYQPNWAPTPPCPYPTSRWAHPPNSPANASPGILGPTPNNNYAGSRAATSNYAPTAIDSAFQAMTPHPP